MTNSLKVKDFKKEEWFKGMMDEIQAALTEAEFQARWMIIEAYHLVGTEIIKNSEKYQIERREVCSAVATKMGKSERTVYYAVEFAERYPKINKIPGGKSISWHRVCNELLSEGKEKGECFHNGEFITKKFCCRCGRWIKDL